MKQLLTALAVLTLATACSNNPAGPSGPPQIDEPNVSTTAVVLSGLVFQTTADGTVPVEGALVELMQNTQSSMAPARAHKASRPNDSVVVLTTTTDASGHYEFAGIGAGTYSVRITKAGFNIYESGEFSFSGDTQYDAELTLDPNAATERARRARK
jgi:hypothetical protein